MTRRELREHSFKMIFRFEFYETGEFDDQLAAYVNYFEEMKDKDRQYLLDKASAIKENIEELDEKINIAAEGWRTARMNKVDLSVIRLALYEILYEESVPTRVAINEAVEIAKEYGGDESPAFINGILAKLVE